MSKYATEADARIIIDDLLREALWDPTDKSQVLTEFYIQEPTPGTSTKPKCFISSNMITLPTVCFMFNWCQKLQERSADL